MHHANRQYSNLYFSGVTPIVSLQKNLLSLGVLTSVEALAGSILLFQGGSPGYAFIPLLAFVCSVCNAILFHYTRNFIRAGNIQIALSFVLPFFLQSLFGGMVASGMMMLWSLLGLAATLIIVERNRRWAWLLMYMFFIVLSFVLDSAMIFPKPAFATEKFSLVMLAFNLAVIIPVAYVLVKSKVESDIELFNDIKQANDHLAETLKDLEHHKRLLEQAQRISGIAHFELDLAAGSEYWSEEIYAILGLDAADIPSFTLYISRLQEEDRAYRLSYPVETDMPLKDFKFTLRTIDSNGRIRHIEENSIVIKDPQGKNIRIQGTIQDITEEKQIEDTLSRAVKLAENASEAKTQFLSTISHEIRTPLNVIHGFSQLLRSKVKDKQLEQYAEQIMTAGENLLALLNNVLALSDLQSGEIRLEQHYFRLSEFVEVLIRNTEAHNPGNIPFELRYETAPEYVYSDYAKLQHVLTCLLSNAFKFTQKGTVTLQVGPAQENFILFSVKDTGIGIPPEKLDSMFEPFKQQQPGLARKYAGTGMGLALARQLTQVMNGTIRAQSLLDVGSTFIVSVPYRERTLAC